MDPNKYCNSLFNYSRFQTREVIIGNITIGGDHHLMLQSMTTTDTMNTEATVAQSIRMIEAGCELVRITAPSKDDAENLANIKSSLREKGFTTPLVADIHFTPNAAEIAAGIVEKVRVNPGNYADKKKFQHIEYTDAGYDEELQRISERFTPLVLLCKKNGTAMRIGTNHGSLSDRILSRYGDTPLGMVESAMEFCRICRDHDFHDIVISMKASNTLVMVQAYRLLVNHMMRDGMNYPIHLGVTEAGDGEDGRIKSAVGIGTLLEDGLGDTIRVSLTEEPEAEIPVARMLAERYAKRANHAAIENVSSPINPFEHTRRYTQAVLNVGGKNVPRVIMAFSERKEITAASLFAVGYQYSVPLDKYHITDLACDFVYCGKNKVDFEIPGTLGLIYDYPVWKEISGRERCYPMIASPFADLTPSPSPKGEGSVNLTPTLSKGEGEHMQFPESEIVFVKVSIHDLSEVFISLLKSQPNVVLVLTTENDHGMAEQRAAFFKLMNAGCTVPVIISRAYTNLNEDQFMLYSATDCGALLVDGLGDGIFLSTQDIAMQRINSTAFGILQATRTRISKTEYISCPSCGRTEFDLQITTAKIRARTAHLKGVKIGIMGCIVNGPGEMADADYGYVGTGPGKITLYKEKNVVKRNVPEAQAVDELIGLIKEGGDWVEEKN
ncbi:MAG: (E)-4-hydroxy-3-methylbut-2-enyl-diphosphate synthase [Flavobacteriales bacterium]|nr:(E)-4-hydroxy-3-methylbut-2-enyl-diphosphate synthase [Flavobacteriales bacterium]